MARTVTEIKKEMTDKFMSDETLRTAYGIAGDTTWDSTFSSVSIENIILYIVAVCAYTLEVLFDEFKQDVEDRIAQNIVPTIRWYHTQSVNFQYGDALIFDESTQSFRYASEDESKKVIKYCAVRDRGGSIQVLVSGDSDGKPSVLSNDVLTAFKSYMNSVKIAGVILDIRSLPADSIEITAQVEVDPQQITEEGVRISDGSYPIVDAVNAYLANIVYGGTFNKTKCVDAIQNVPGVTDVLLQQVRVKSSGGSYTVLEGNNYTAVGGCFVSDNLNNTLSYVV